jgi:Fe-S-cluster containining protein
MPGTLCEHCTALCCRYIALPIDTPRTSADFNDMRWFLLHEGVSVFVEDGDWYISILTTCRHLQAGHRCGIYEERPRICRSYSTENCDYHSGDYGWQHHFTCPEHLDEYRRVHWRREQRHGRGQRSRGRHRGARLKAHPRRPKPTNYAAQTRDIRGIPLPVIGAAS